MDPVGHLGCVYDFEISKYVRKTQIKVKMLHSNSSSSQSTKVSISKCSYSMKEKVLLLQKHGQTLHQLTSNIFMQLA